MTCTKCGRDNHDSIDCFALWSQKPALETMMERVRAETWALGTARDELLDELAKLRAQARARRVPTREELAKLLLGRSHGDVPWEAFGERIRQRYLEDADAVLRLFADADATDHAQQRAAEPTPGTVLGTARVVFRGKVEPREVETPDAPEDRYVPTVGERAVLVSSPVPEDRSMCERVVDIYGTDESSTSFYWLVTCDTGVQRTIHRDATWRPASAAPATFIADKVNAKLAHLEGKTQGMAEGTAGEFRRVDATLRALTKRVERIERAMEVELAAYDMRFEREERERAK